MTEIKNNEINESEQPWRECKTKDDFDKALNKKEDELKFDIETSRQERNRAEYKADKLGSITEEEKRENAEKRQEALEAKRQDYQDAVWKKEGEEWKKNEINDPKQKEKVDQAEKDWEAQIKSNKRQEMIDEKRPVEEKTDIKPDTGGIESGNERTREGTEVNNQKNGESETIETQKQRELELVDRQKYREGAYRDKTTVSGVMDSIQAAKDKETIMGTEPLEKDTVYYRGMHLPNEKADAMVNGGIIENDHLTSAAKDRLSANAFTADARYSTQEKGVLMEIEAPSGSHILDVSKVTGYKDRENEVIMAPGSKLEIQNGGYFDKDLNSYVVKAKYVDPETEKK